MPKITKNLIIAISATVILIFGGVIGLVVIQKSKFLSEEKAAPQEVSEIFTLPAIVSSVNIENNFLMVKPTDQEKEVKVIISETTELIKLEFPFNPTQENLLKETTFTPKQTEIKISDFKPGDDIFIKAKENITDKTEINDIEFIHLLP